LYYGLKGSPTFIFLA
jgi:hypothetical protein